MMTPKAQQQRLPEKPGVYQFFNSRGAILYVGKAKNIKKRVANYFRQTRTLEPSKRRMVREIARIEVIVTDTETEALLLEATMINKHRPPYNIIIKDEKDFLYIRVTLEEDFPTVLATRRAVVRGSRYFGPYTSAASTRATVKLIKRVFLFRTCEPGKGKPCFDVHLGRCLGPCANAISKAAYHRRVVLPILRFLSGKTEETVRSLRKEMHQAAHRKEYEQAARHRDRLAALERIAERQKMIAPRRDRFDIISAVRDRDWTAINLFQIREGRVFLKQNFLLDQPEGSTDDEALGAFINQFYAMAADRPNKVFARGPLAAAAAIRRLLGITLASPQRGRKRKLLLLGETNARECLERRKAEWLSDRERVRKALEGLTTALNLSAVPRRIEAFDVSNVQGVDAVGSMIVFENGKPHPSAYRKFHIRSQRRPDDFVMLAEIVRRRLQHTDWPRPDCIILDGGKGQLSVTLRATENIKNRPPMVALAKREEELFLPRRSAPLRFPVGSPALFLLQRIRDEAHRFAITFFRKTHGKSSMRSQLDDVPGVGRKTKRYLLRRFGTLRGIRDASDDELRDAVGAARAEQIRETLG